jgi:hypothetical protein
MRNRAQRPPAKLTRAPASLPSYTFITEEEAVAECQHRKRFYLGTDVGVCKSCGRAEWTWADTWPLLDEDEAARSLFFYLSVQRALEHY